MYPLRSSYFGFRVFVHLVEALGDEVRREGLLKLLLVLKGVVLLGVRHGSGLEPAVEDIFHALERGEAGPALGRDLDVVDKVTVEVRHLAAREPLQLLDRPDADDLYVGIVPIYIDQLYLVFDQLLLISDQLYSFRSTLLGFLSIVLSSRYFAKRIRFSEQGILHQPLHC